jgi:hypothetical protein
VADAVKDSFATEARAFVAQWDRLKLPGRKSFGDIPDPEIVRPVIHQAEFICYQNDNPFRDFTDVDLWTMRLASVQGTRLRQTRHIYMPRLVSRSLRDLVEREIQRA